MNTSGAVTFEELIEDTHFMEWVQSGRVSHNDKWQPLLGEHQETIEEAAFFVENFQFKKQEVIEDDILLEWNKLEARISKPTHQMGRRVWLTRIAAAVLLLVVSGASFLFYTKNSLIVKSTTEGELLDVTLSDASNIKLKPNSKISFKKKWGKQEIRTVQLEGQAFFDIETTPEKSKFQVETDRFTIEVLGTQFDVKVDAAKASVVLQEGKIKVLFPQSEIVVVQGEAKSRTAIELSPNECLTYSDKKYYKTKVNTANYIAWLDKNIRLDNTNLEKIAHLITDLYGIEIIFGSDELKKLKFGGTPPIENLQVLLDALEFYDISIEKVSEKSLKFVKR